MFNTMLFPPAVLDVLHKYLEVGPFDGGCLTFAKGLLYYHQGGEIVYLASSLNGGQVEHFGLRLGSEVIDASGVYDSESSWKDAFENVHNRIIEKVGVGIPDDHQALDCNWTARQIADTIAAEKPHF